MSTLLANHDDDSPVEMVVNGRKRDIGGFAVRRILPFAKKRMVGPFIFLDEMGPVEFLGGDGIDVLPHPHIGLSTLTYLFDGSMMHRDSTGVEMEILPGDVNWMTAGSGVAHSERSTREGRARGGNMAGLQAWVALPADREEDRASFEHRARGDLPLIEGEGKKIRLIGGSMFGKTSPLGVSSPLIYADIALQTGTKLPVDPDYEERAVYVLSGSVRVGNEIYEPHGLMVLRPGATVTITALVDTRLVILGGEPLEGPRHIWWNFVSSSKERIEQAKADWREGRFEKVVNDAEEFVPLPG